MKTVFLIYGTIICLVFVYAVHAGWTVSDSLLSGKWGPQGHSVYHK